MIMHFNECIILLCFLPTLICIICTTFQDATANDVPSETFEVQGYPTLYFKKASGEVSQYEGGRTKEDIIEFIEKNKDKKEQVGIR